MAAATVIMQAIVAMTVAPAAIAANATAASFTPVSGSYKNPVTGQVHAVQGGVVRLDVTTSTDTRCVEVTLTSQAQKLVQTNATPKTAWSFTITAGSGDSTVGATAVAFANVNAGGNCNNGGGGGGGTTAQASYSTDNTSPVVSGTRSPAANAAGWNNADTTITWSATDGTGSGVKTGPTPASATVTAETAGTSRSATATDQVGNTGSGSVAVKLDKTLPSIGATRSPAANAHGWNNSDVTVSLTCSDELSGIKSCSGGGSVVVSAEGADRSVAGEAVDNADNRATRTVGGISIDKTRPALAGAVAAAPVGVAPDGTAWYAGDVAVDWTASDALSGLDGGAPARSHVTGEGKGLTVSATVADKAGNATTAASEKVNIDRTAPSTDAVAPAGWTATDQTVTLAPADALSGVAATHYRLDGDAAQTGTSIAIAGDGVHTLEYWSVDHAGNAEEHKSVEVHIDGSSPTISHTLDPLPNANGWHRGAVAVTFTCADSVSGIASCTGDRVVSDEGADQIVTGTATDNAGNTATDPASVSIDKTAPEVSATADRSPDADSGWYRDDVVVSFQATDALSGVDTVDGPVTLHEGAGQSATGTATDAAGNTGSATLSGLDVDKTEPELEGAATTEPNAAGWYAGDVTVAWACSDALSGIAGDCPADSVLEGEGADLAAAAEVADEAGNVATATVGPIRIDRTAPNTTASVPEPLESGWYAGPVTVELATASDLSGVDTTYYRVDGGEAQRYDGPFDHAAKGEHTIRFWSVDRAGNVEDADAPGHAVTLKIDGIAPSITGDRTPANAFGWNNTPVDVSFVCDDAESGIDACLGGTTIGDETPAEGVSVTGTARDRAGNSNSATVGPMKVDLTKPTLTGTPTTRDNAAGWYRGDVAIAWEGADGLSGIDPATLPQESVIGGEGRGLVAGPETVSDKAGNASDPTPSAAVNIARTAPGITGATVADDGTPRAAGAGGWFDSAVRVRFACSDELSGVAACASDAVLDQDGTGLSATGGATDSAGNTASTTVDGIKIDSHAPQTSATLECSSRNEYCNASSGDTAVVRLDAIDPGPAAGIETSGVKEIRHRVDGGDVVTETGAAATVQIPLDGSGTAVVEYWAVDVAGNVERAGRADVAFDTVAPTVIHTLTPEANAAGWNREPTTVHFSAEDDVDGSGVDPATVTPDVTVSDETAGRNVQGSAEDRAGNKGTDQVTVKLDRTKPTIEASVSGTPGDNGWYTTPVGVAFTCGDAGTAPSGVAACAAARTLGNGQSAEGTAEDRAGNTASAAAGPFKIDGDAPAITLNGIADGGVYTLGSVPAAGCSAADGAAGSGVAGACAVQVTGGTANGVGTYAFTARAKDAAGNVATTTGSYRVVYRVSTGTAFWQQPINDTAHTTSTTTSVFKAGSTVPAKFRITDAAGRTVRTNAAPAWLVPTKGSAMTSPVDEAVATVAADSGATFRWTDDDQQYIYNWGTAKTQAGFYWKVGVRLDDGTTHTISIGLR